MTQAQLVTLLLKISTVAGFVAIARWIWVYSRLEPWWRSRVGVSLVVKSGLVAALNLVFALSLFFQFNRQTSEIAAWVAVAILASIVPVMEWRTWIWKAESRAARQRLDAAPPPAASPEAPEKETP